MNRTGGTASVREPAMFDADLTPKFDAERWDEITDDDPIDCTVLCQSHWRTSIPGTDD